MRLRDARTGRGGHEGQAAAPRLFARGSQRGARGSQQGHAGGGSLHVMYTPAAPPFARCFADWAGALPHPTLPQPNSSGHVSTKNKYGGVNTRCIIHMHTRGTGTLLREEA
jgi:hypothetical protein